MSHPGLGTYLCLCIFAPVIWIYSKCYGDPKLQEKAELIDDYDDNEQD